MVSDLPTTRSDRASIAGRVTLAIAWVVLLAGVFGVLTPAWLAEAASLRTGLSSFSSAPNLALLLSYGAGLGLALVWSAVAVPLYLLACIALPPSDRRTLPWVAALWLIGAIVASTAAPDGRAWLFAVTVVPTLVSLEMLRVLLTSLVHELSTAVEHPAT